VVIVEVLDAMTDATMVGTVVVEDMTTIAAHLHPTIDVMITDEDLDLDLTHHVDIEDISLEPNYFVRIDRNACGRQEYYY